MKKRDFIGELLKFGTGFALTFLVMVGLAVTTALFLIAMVVAAFFERLMH